jgi:hypothetical protein
MNKFFFLIPFTFYAGINYYLFIRGWQALPENAVIQTLFAILFVLFAVSFFIAFGIGNKLPLVVTAVLENIGAVWIIGLLYFISATLFADILRLADHLFGIFPDWMTDNRQPTTDNLQQIGFIYLISVLIIFSIFCIIGYIRFTRPVVRHLELTIPKGEGPAGRITIAAASDVHLGNIIRKRRLGKYVELLNRQEADIILFVGDLLDHSVRPVAENKMDEVLAQLKTVYGVFGVFGNHEHYGNASEAAEFFKRANINLLKDEMVNIDDRFILIGRDDISFRNRKPLGEILAGVNGELPKILLDHNPSRLADAQKNGINLQLSGHTHNGQIWPLNHLVKRIFPLAYGYLNSNGTHYYVSAGLGLWAAPVRIGTRSEIVRIEVSLV